MAEKTVAEVVVRPKRQVTLPREICERLGIGPGDRLELALEGATLVARPKKAVALEALREIREAFRRSGISEKELQRAGRLARQEAVKARLASTK